MIEVVGLVAWPLSVALIAALTVGVGFRAFEAWLVHRERKLSSAPVAELQQRLERLEAQVLSRAMGR